MCILILQYMNFISFSANSIYGDAVIIVKSKIYNLKSFLLTLVNKTRYSIIYFSMDGIYNVMMLDTKIYRDVKYDAYPGIFHPSMLVTFVKY